MTAAARLSRAAMAALMVSCACASVCAAAPAASAEKAGRKEAPLTGKAWRHANQAYASFKAGRYAQAEQQARSAIALRPDLLRLRMLQIYSLQKLGKNAQALEAVAAAEAAGLQSDELRAAKANLQAPSASPASEAYRQAFPLATEAFADYNAQKYESSARLAEQAVRIDPSQGAWALLWISALEAQDQLKAAIEAADTALALGAPNTNDLIARKQSLLRSLSTEPTIAAYKALSENDPGSAATQAREAVRLSPDAQSLRLLLMTALLYSNQLPAAEETASEALKHDDEDTSSLVFRGYLRQRQNKTELANQDFDEAIAQDWLDDDQRASIRLIAADAALAAGDHERVKALLAPLDADDKPVADRLALAGQHARPPRRLTTGNYPPPFQDCHDTPYGTACEMKPADESMTGSASAKAYAAYGRQDYQEAIAQARIAVEQAPDNPGTQLLLTITLAAGDDEQRALALTRLDSALQEHPDDASLLMQRGYLYQRQREPEKALRDFQAARDTGKAPPSLVLDEGFALASAGRKPEAIQALKQAIDMDDNEELELTPEQRYFTRSSVAGLSREWGASVSASYRGARPAGSGLNGTPITTAGDSVFSSADIFWRPQQFLNGPTQVFEVYGRVMNTLRNGSSVSYDQSVIDPCTGLPSPVSGGKFDGVSGFPTTLGSVGVRFTPSTDYAFTLGLERRFLLGTGTRTGTVTPASAELRCKLSGRDPSQPGAPVVGNAQTINFDGSASSGGWLAYATYGFYEGTGLRFDKDSWFTMEGYLQAGYYREDLSANFWTTDASTGERSPRQRGRYRRDQWFANAEVRVGRSFRMDSVSDHLLIFPHLVAAVDFQRQNYRARVPGFAQEMAVLGNGSSWASGVGAGVSLRYAFREDHYNAPRSYMDWTIQYRTNVGGGQADRAKGWFMSLSVWY